MFFINIYCTTISLTSRIPRFMCLRIMCLIISTTCVVLLICIWRWLKIEEPRHQEIWGLRSLGGAPSSTWKPPPHPRLPSTNSGTFGWSETSGAGAPIRADLGAARQALVEVHHRRAAIEGSLPPTVEGSLNTNRIHRGGKGRV